MIGILLVSISSLLLECSSSIGKFKSQQKELGTYTFGFLLVLTMPLLFFITGIIKDNFHFEFASLPTLITRIILEIIAVPVTVKAIVAVERSTYTFIRTITIPILLVIDVVLGYAIHTNQLIGMAILVIAILGLLTCKKIKKQGISLAITSSMIAAGTITLYKYDITHYNSIEAEQLIVMTVLLIYFFMMAKIYEGNPIQLLSKKTFLLQSGTYGCAGVLESFAYTFAPASVIVTAIRATGALWSIIAGKIYFHEQHLWLRIMLGIVIVIGIALLI